MISVKLVHDYTKYNIKLEKGIIGYAFETPEEQKERKVEDNFVKVDFDGITTVDVLWKGLEIVDESYLSEKQRIKDLHLSKMVTASEVVKTIGPKEGFKKLEFKYINEGIEENLVTEDKKEAEEYIAVFEKSNVPITVVMLESKLPKSKNNIEE